VPQDSGLHAVDFSDIESHTDDHWRAFRCVIINEWLAFRKWREVGLRRDVIIPIINTLRLTGVTYRMK
jgi:hypothetical protein